MIFRMILFFVVLLFLGNIFFPAFLGTVELLIMPFFICSMFFISPTLRVGTIRALFFAIASEIISLSIFGSYLIPTLISALLYWGMDHYFDFSLVNRNISRYAQLGRGILILAMIYIFSLLVSIIAVDFAFIMAFRNWLLLFEPTMIISNFVMIIVVMFLAQFPKK